MLESIHQNNDILELIKNYEEDAYIWFNSDEYLKVYNDLNSTILFK